MPRGDVGVWIGKYLIHREALHGVGSGSGRGREIVAGLIAHGSSFTH